MMMIPILTLCVYVMKRVWVRTVKFDIFSDSIVTPDDSSSIIQ